MPGKVTLTEAVQRQASGAGPQGGEDTARVHQAAQLGVSGPAQPLPHLATIQQLFGPHDVTGVRAHVGGPAAAAAQAMGASAYATGSAVAFREAPDLHTVAHEAAHVVQQRGGVQLKGGVGEAGDAYEQNADAVADRVVRGESAADLLPGGRGSAVVGLQRQEAAPPARASQRSAAELLGEAIEVIETALAVATGDIGDDAADARRSTGGAGGGAAADGNGGGAASTDASRGRPEAVSHLQAALAGLAALHGAPEDAIRTAVMPILRQVGAPGLADAGAPDAAAAAPVQRNTLVLGAPLLGAGPPGWVAYAVLGVATVGIMGYAAYQTYRSRARERERAEPRVEPRVVPRTDPPQHRGRIQVQGGGLELSFPWARPTPMTKVEGLAGLAGLKAMLTRGQLADRDDAFLDAAAFITATLHTCPPDISRTFQNRTVRQRRGDERVDIEIRTGVAFA